MSRIGKKPITLPKGVEVKFEKSVIKVKGPKGELALSTHPKITYREEEGKIFVERVDDTRVAREQHGLRRTLLYNAVVGVSEGFKKTLEVIGVGYKVAVKGNKVELNVGYSHPVQMELPKDLSAQVEGNKLTILGISKERVGEYAARIRRVRPPEPYKGKGIKYLDEQIRRKAGKTGKK
ncbi:50S ribosomal protein L6 [Desulfonauticus submarinus]|uniref:Large ribosomal subunit protein uL6 n=1 Tax=Desulfonauticus submarinus TaxID=206665 RepID=A0A1H0G4U3_9BACT|nr:50S ribosomal protein L6 [Desulfonauticus submarinus]SDO01861.1 large subunit ribosomal protein L6 [Desulfonauticus submarinus]